MALAFKRSVAEAQTAVDAVNESIKGWYNTTVNPAVTVNFDGIKTVAGNSTQNPNSEDLPKNITLVNWVKDNAQYFHSVFGDIQYKDKENALPVALKHLEKVVISVDDKGVAGAYNSYDVEWKGKEVHITVHIDFTNYPQALNLTDEKSNVDERIWAHLDDVANITYEIKKAVVLSYEHSQLKTYQKYLDEKITKKKIPIEVDWESIHKLAGKSIEYSNKPPVPNNARTITFLEDGRGFYNIYYAIEALVKDDMGMEAFLDTFDKVHVSVATSTEENSGPHEITKDGKTLKFRYKLNFENLQNANVDYSAMAKQIEALL